jgi:cytochrome c oxidase subunit 3
MTPFDSAIERNRAGRLGMGLFLISLGMLFAASLIGYIVIRLQLGREWPDLPPLPKALWLSTAVLALSSATMHWAMVNLRSRRTAALRLAMLLTTMLGLTFLGIQAACWLEWRGPVLARGSEANPYRFALTAFYVLTALHAAHVIGGLVPMSYVTARLMASRANRARPALEPLAMYWHFLDAVWMVLFLMLKFSN